MKREDRPEPLDPQLKKMTDNLEGQCLLTEMRYMQSKLIRIMEMIKAYDKRLDVFQEDLARSRNKIDDFMGR